MAVIPLSTSADVRGAERLNKELAKSDKHLEEITKRARGAAGAAERLAKQADPLKRNADQMARLAVAVKKGGLELDHARTLAAKYQKQLDRAQGSGERAFGQNALARLGAYAAGFVSLSSAVGIVTKALRDQEEQAKQSLERSFSALSSLGELQQISKTPEEFRQHVAFARSLRDRGIVSDLGQAGSVAFSLSSAGYTDEEKEYLANLSANKQLKGEDLAAFGGALKKTRTLYADGTPVEDLADKVLATSGITQVGAVETASAASQFSTASANLKYNGDRSLAALATIEQIAKNIDESGTQYANLLDAIDKGGLNQGGLNATLDYIQGRIDKGEGAFDVLGNKRAVKGFRALQSQRGFLDEQTAVIAASKGSFENRRFIDEDPELAALSKLEESRGRLAGAQGDLTNKNEALSETIRNDLRTLRLQRGQRYRASVMGAYEGALDYFQQEQDLVVTAVGEEGLPASTRADAARWMMDNMSPWQRSPFGYTDDYLRRIAEAVEQKPARQE